MLEFGEASSITTPKASDSNGGGEILPDNDEDVEPSRWIVSLFLATLYCPLVGLGLD
jgi:hypothetical protein